MLKSEFYDIAIIGGGPGGLSAAVYATRASLKTVLIERGILGGQINVTHEVENYLGTGKIGGTKLAEKFSDHAKKYDFDIVMEEVVNLNFRDLTYELILSNGKKIKSFSVILAMGGRPRKLGVPGEIELYGNGVSYCATCDGFFFRNKVVVVVGGGDSAVEEALYLSKICEKVYLIHRKNCLRASIILQNRLEKNKKIAIIWNTKLTIILSDENGVSSVKLIDIKTEEKSELKVDGVFIFVGYEPNTELVRDKVAVNNDGMIIANELCETSKNGLYAVGDIRVKSSRQIVLSVADGCNAALTAARYIESIKK